MNDHKASLSDHPNANPEYDGLYDAKLAMLCRLSQHEQPNKPQHLAFA
jgi:hypothetical protein